YTRTLSTVCKCLIEIFVIFISFLCYIFFFFSSRRRHTRFKCDWSSDVCSSDLARRSRSHHRRVRRRVRCRRRSRGYARGEPGDRSEERRVGKSVDLGGRGIIRKKKEKLK